MLGRNSFPSKILLFGEYTIIRNSNALAVPFELFEGSLIFPKKDSKYGRQNVNGELFAFSKYLKGISLPFDGCSVDTDSFSFDVSQGLSFESSIPQGYGVGSSGALCSAIFQRYGHAPMNILNDPKKMKVIFSNLENHFHGESSGIDPLISFYSKPILLNELRDISIIDIVPPHKGEGEMFLLNTGRARRTEPLVSLFLEKCKNQVFTDTLDEMVIPTSNRCINLFLEGNYQALKNDFQALSELQYEHFIEMIPKLFRPVWKKGISSREYSLKLCGAGGGGFILGFSRDLERARTILSDFDIRPLRFN
jgi:mevalonate kinase